MKTLINWNSSKVDTAKISRIAERAQASMGGQLLDWIMDITACHMNGTQLDLDKLEAFDDGNFNHDVSGIARHIDRDSGQITGFFLPRSASKD